jgi:GMP synthase (glutamine-hydrolysing)
MRLLLLQHDPHAGLGAYARILAEHGVEGEPCVVKGAARLPDWRRFDGIVALDGEHRLSSHPLPAWLARERDYVASAVRAGLPFWGVCFGAELLAASLEARVYQVPLDETGLQAVHLTAAGRADPIFQRAPAKFKVFQGHGDRFDLPRGGVVLAESLSDPRQAFRWGARAYGLQFPLEVTREMAWDLSSSSVRGWHPDRAWYSLLGQLLPEAIAQALFDRWLQVTWQACESAA